MKRSYIIILIISVLLTGCKQNEENQAASTPEATNEETHSAHVEEEGWEREIKLNDGSQWEANRETTRGIRNMSRLIDRRSPESVEEYKELGVDLTEEVNTLIKECTMKGPSHDNLHIYLEPLIIGIAQLREVLSEEEGEQLVLEIEEHLNAYDRYFA